MERKLLSYCGGARTCMGSTPPRSSHPPCGAFSSNVSSSQVNKVITLCKASGRYTVHVKNVSTTLLLINDQEVEEVFE